MIVHVNSLICKRLPHKVSIHPADIILIAERSQHFQFSISMNHSYGGMGDAIEHICLDRGIMYHILEDDVFAYLQLMVKFPKAHKVTAQTGIATQSVKMWCR